MPPRDGRLIHGVLVTHKRPRRLATTLERLRDQDELLETLIVVDNAPDDANEAVVRRARSARSVTYIAAPENIGPAGGIALGMERVVGSAHDLDWVVTLDDDDPPRTPSLFRELLDFGTSMLSEDGRTGGVGHMGARFDYRRARMVRIADHELSGPVGVDYIGGNQFPMYSVRAVREIGPFDPDLFWGLEELEYGLRMRSAGYSLYAHGDLWRARREENQRLELAVRPSLRLRTGRYSSDWRRYYVLRNLIHILVASGHRGSAARVTIIRGVGKPVANLVLAPGRAVGELKVSVRACRDGWRGISGRTFEPDGSRDAEAR